MIRFTPCGHLPSTRTVPFPMIVPVPTADPQPYMVPGKTIVLALVKTGGGGDVIVSGGADSVEVARAVGPPVNSPEPMMVPHPITVPDGVLL